MNARLDGSFLLSLADGTRLALCSGDGDAARVISFLAHKTCLEAGPVPLPDGLRRLNTVVGDGALSSGEGPSGDVLYRFEPIDVRRVRGRTYSTDGRVKYVFESLTPDQWLWRQLVRLSAAIGREAQARGGVLLHSALAEWVHQDAEGMVGEGVLLGGRSGAGKTTASLRLRPPWRSLADDITLVVRDSTGAYWAHPWPTWSRLLGQDMPCPEMRWDVQRAVRLRALFFLEQAPADGAELIGPGQAVCRLAALAEQASRPLLLGRPPEEIAPFNLQRFENLCALAKALPTYLLSVSPNGPFWREMEKALQIQNGEAGP